jgi:ABC-type branched-subunit amino acid transport system ATPase component
MRLLPARQLPLLRRKRLEVARALALEPQLLLLDEVGAGLIDSEITELIALIHAVGASGTTLVIVEHVLRIVRECCSRLLVLNFGRELAAGTPAEILASDAVASVYLGTTHTRAAALQVPAVLARTDSLAALIGSLSVPGAAAPSPLLRLRNIDVSYGLVPALRSVSLEVRAGEVVAVLGANGAGKTTLAQLISGALRAQRGSVEVDGVPAPVGRADQIAALGIAHCMEGRRIFADLSVEQNLMIAARRCSRPQIALRLAAVYALFPVLAERHSDPGTAMSGGQQQMLAIGRTLMARPRLAVFDEISLGLAPIVIDRLYESLTALKRAGLAMLIVEQDVDRALEIADRAVVLEHGVLAFEGAASEVRSDVRLRRLYLGESE